jgi:hypothetical protein
MPARYAPGRLVSVDLPFFLCPLPLATVSDQLVKISEPSSQTLLCAAVCLMLDLFSDCSLVIKCLISDDFALLTPLSVNVFDRHVSLKLVMLQSIS